VLKLAEVVFQVVQTVLSDAFYVVTQGIELLESCHGGGAHLRCKHGDHIESLCLLGIFQGRAGVVQKAIAVLFQDLAPLSDSGSIDFVAQ